MKDKISIICLESEAFYALIDEVVVRISEKNPETKERWIDDDQAMSLLGVKSKTTMQKYRDERKIRFTQPSRKVILYDRLSIEEFLDKNATDTWT